MNKRAGRVVKALARLNFTDAVSHFAATILGTLTGSVSPAMQAATLGRW